MKRLTALILLACLVVGCGAPTPTPASTVTSTPTATPTATSTLTPPPTLTPSATPIVISETLLSQHLAFSSDQDTRVFRCNLIESGSLMRPVSVTVTTVLITPAIETEMGRILAAAQSGTPPAIERRNQVGSAVLVLMRLDMATPQNVDQVFNMQLVNPAGAADAAQTMFSLRELTFFLNAELASLHLGAVRYRLLPDPAPPAELEIGRVYPLMFAADDAPMTSDDTLPVQLNLTFDMLVPFTDPCDEGQQQSFSFALRRFSGRFDQLPLVYGDSFVSPLSPAMVHDFRVSLLTDGVRLQREIMTSLTPEPLPARTLVRGASITPLPTATP